MVRRIKYRNVVIALLMIMTAFGCQPDPLEYARPTNLVGTIYPQLEALGNFEYYLKCIDKTAYKAPLEKGGSWTVFAPTDEAFEEFMAIEGYNTFEEIPSDRILDLVQYSLFSGGWNTTSLTYFGTSAVGKAYKKVTQYQDTIIEVNGDDYPNVEDVVPGKIYKIDDSNGDMKASSYFVPYYMEATGFERSDYDFMFPGETFSETDEMRVFEANAVGANTVAENGFIHAIDKVIEPRKNLYQNLDSEEYGGKYSIFKGLMEKFAEFRSQGYQLNETTGEEEEIFRLQFQTGITNSLLPYSLYDETYPKILNNANRDPSNGVGMAVPTNDAMLAYLEGDSVLGRFYDSYDDMSKDVLFTFLSTHFFTQYWDLCPSRQGETFNVSLNYVDYKLEDVVDRKFCSNGFFVGVDKVYTNDKFGTVLGPLLLDPEYAIMSKAYQRLGITDGLASTGVNFSVFGLKNDQFVNIPDPSSATRKISIVDYTEDFSVIQIQVTGDPVEENNRLYPEDIDSPENADIAYVEETLNDIVLNQLVDGDVTLNSGSYYQTRTRSFIQALSDGSVAGSGDLLAGETANVTLVRETINGKFYEMDKHFQRPLDYVYKSLVDNNDKFSKFVEILELVDAFTVIPDYAADKLLNLVGSTKSYTLLAPNNTGIQQAIDDGLIKDPNNLPTDEVELAIAKRDLLNFAKLHILQDPIVTDAVTTGSYKSLYIYQQLDEFTPLYREFEVGNVPGELILQHSVSNEVTTTGDLVNLFTKGIVIHELDGYLKF